MNKIIWAAQIALAAVFLMAGAMKLIIPKAEMAKNMPWVEDYSETEVKLIGTVEVLGAIGVVAPAALKILPFLTPLAASGLALTMAFAAKMHLGRQEYDALPVNAILFLIAIFVAYMRWRSYKIE